MACFFLLRVIRDAVTDCVNSTDCYQYNIYVRLFISKPGCYRLSFSLLLLTICNIIQENTVEKSG